MGNRWGVIHNQTNQDVLYTLHSHELSPFEQTIKKSAELGAKLNPIEGALQVEGNAKYQTQLKKELLKNDGVYVLPAGRIGTSGLSKIDFDEIKFWTIVTATGKIIVKSGKITCEKDIRVRIRDQDFSLKSLSQEQAQKLKSFATGGTMDTGKCSKCQTQKADFKQLQDDSRCRQCNGKFNRFWICRQVPGFHYFCQNCHKSGAFYAATKK